MTIWYAPGPIVPAAAERRNARLDQDLGLAWARPSADEPPPPLQLRRRPRRKPLSEGRAGATSRHANSRSYFIRRRPVRRERTEAGVLEVAVGEVELDHAARARQVGGRRRSMAGVRLLGVYDRTLPRSAVRAGLLLHHEHADLALHAGAKSHESQLPRRLDDAEDLRAPPKLRVPVKLEGRIGVAHPLELDLRLLDLVLEVRHVPERRRRAKCPRVPKFELPPEDLDHVKIERN